MLSLALFGRRQKDGIRPHNAVLIHDDFDLHGKAPDFFPNVENNAMSESMQHLAADAH